MGLVLVKVSHCYVGTLESWLERGRGRGGKGTLVVVVADAQDIKSWKKRDQRSAPYTDRFDPSLGSDQSRRGRCR